MSLASAPSPQPSYPTRVRYQVGPTSAAPLFLAAACLLAAACVPAPGGQCAADADCRTGTTCQRGLCRPQPACAEPCAAGLHCAAGLCAPDSAPTLAWVTPEDAAQRAGGVLALELSVQNGGPARGLRVFAVRPGGLDALPVSVALRRDGPQTWRGELDASQLGEAAWQLVPVLALGDALIEGPARGLRIDRTGPAIELALPQPASAAFRRDDTLEVRARIGDEGSGVDPHSVALLAPGMDPIPGTQRGPAEWSFTLPLSRPSFPMLEGALALRVVARDRVGNGGAAQGSVRVTRVLWRRDLGAGLAIRSSPALDAAHLYVGTDAGKLIALDRPTGVTLWSRQLAGPVSGSPARGTQAVYAASEGGTVVALEPATGAVRWTCPELEGVMKFAASPAVARLTGLAGPGTWAEAVYLVNDSQLPSGQFGGVVAVEGSVGFPALSGRRPCSVVSALGGGSSSAAVAADGTIHVATRGASAGDHRARKLRFAPGQWGDWSFHEEWSAQLADDALSSPALLADGTSVHGDESGDLLELSATGGSLWSPLPALGEKLFASPVLAFGVALAQGRDGTLAPFALQQGAAAQAGNPAFVAHQLPAAADVEATPAVGADGTIYVAAGRSLRALSPSGGVLWEAPLPGGATSSSPALGCDGVLYVGDAAGALVAVATDSQGLAPGWPRFRHDARATGNAASPLCE